MSMFQNVSTICTPAQRARSNEPLQSITRHAKPDNPTTRTASRSRSRTLLSVLSDEIPLEIATAQPPAHLQRSEEKFDNLMEYRSFCRRYNATIVPADLIHSTPSHPPIAPKVPSPLRNELKPDKTAQYTPYKRKARLPSRRYKFRKHTMRNGSADFSECSVDDSLLPSNLTMDGSNCSTILSPLSCYSEDNDMRVAFTILQRYINKIGPLWTEYFISLEEQCQEDFLRIAHLTEDQMGEFMTMSREGKLRYYKAWCVKEDERTRDALSLKMDERLKELHLARYPHIKSDHSFPLRDPESVKVVQFAQFPDLEADRSNQLSDRKIGKTCLNPSKLRTLRKNRKNADYFRQDFVEYPTSELDILSFLSDCPNGSQPETFKSRQRSNIHNLYLITVLENWTQYEVDNESYFEEAPWKYQPYLDIVPGVNCSIVLNECHNPTTLALERAQRMDKLGDLFLREVDKVQDATMLNHSLHANDLRPRQLPLRQPHSPAQVRLLETKNFTTREQNKLGLIAEGPPKFSGSVGDLQRLLGYGPWVVLEIQQVPSHSKSINDLRSSKSMNNLRIPPGYGPPVVPKRKPVSQNVEVNSSPHVKDSGVVLPTVIRGMSRSNRSSEISDLELPGPGFSEEALAVADIKVVAEHLESKHVEFKGQEIKEFKCSPSVDDLSSTREIQSTSQHTQKTAYEDEFGSPFTPADVKRSLSKLVDDRFLRAKAVIGSLGRKRDQCAGIENELFSGSERMKLAN